MTSQPYIENPAMSLSEMGGPGVAPLTPLTKRTVAGTLAVRASAPRVGAFRHCQARHCQAEAAQRHLLAIDARHPHLDEDIADIRRAVASHDVRCAWKALAVWQRAALIVFGFAGYLWIKSCESNRLLALVELDELERTREQRDQWIKTLADALDNTESPRH